MTTQYTIYFAGALFNHKDLTGNALLASFIEQASGGRYRCVLPQDLEQTTSRAVEIRNQDLLQLMQCDLAIFNFDGTELDSGTVVEFIYAKLLDIPSVIVRSDFRGSGDQDKDGDDWNLMASFYPRTGKLLFNAMAWYQEETARGGTLEERASRFYQRIASALVEQLDAARSEPPLSKGTQADMVSLYEWALRFPGDSLAERLPEASFVEKIVSEKIEKRLL
jgi:nucleoside 2-deoxyribosyltransferase